MNKYFNRGEINSTVKTKYFIIQLTTLSRKKLDKKLRMIVN